MQNFCQQEHTETKHGNMLKSLPHKIAPYFLSLVVFGKGLSTSNPSCKKVGQISSPKHIAGFFQNFTSATPNQQLRSSNDWLIAECDGDKIIYSISDKKTFANGKHIWRKTSRLQKSSHQIVKPAFLKIFLRWEFPPILKKSNCGIAATKGPFGCPPSPKKNKSSIATWPHPNLVNSCPSSSA